MSDLKPIPIGVEDFKEIIDKKFCLVDKTLLIKDLLDSAAKVTLFTRPRRFGKTLNMSMIRRYFEKTDEDNSYLFDGLAISGAGDKYKVYMGQYPVINISLKSMKQASYEDALFQFAKLLSDEFDRHAYLLDSEDISEEDMEEFLLIKRRKAPVKSYCTALTAIPL